MHGAAELRPIGGRFTKQAEAAFSVENDWQSHGVGSALLERTLLTARNRGIAHLHMACLADNRRMQQLARKFDAELSFDFGEVVAEVAENDMPCRILGQLPYVGEDKQAEFIKTLVGRRGWYARVVEEGVVAVGDGVAVE